MVNSYINTEHDLTKQLATPDFIIRMNLASGFILQPSHFENPGKSS